jgi:hypothetical protein
MTLYDVITFSTLLYGCTSSELKAAKHVNKNRAAETEFVRSARE